MLKEKRQRLIVLIIVLLFSLSIFVTAYTITGLEFLTNKEEIAVLLSPIIQASYHVYQGILPMIYVGITFFVFSIFFAKKRRIVPVIIVHLVYDITAMLHYSS